MKVQFFYPKLILLIVLELVFIKPIYAFEDSKYDIKKMTLSSSYLEIKKLLPCSPKARTYKTESGKISGFYLDCRDEYSISFDRNKKIMSINRWVDFSDTKPNYNEIRNRLIKKYGTPTAETKMLPGYDNPNTGYIKTLCWGDCKIEHENNASGKGSSLMNSPKQKRFSVNIRVWGRDNNRLSFHLSDPKKSYANAKWETNENNDFSKRKSKNATNIEF